MRAGRALPTERLLADLSRRSLSLLSGLAQAKVAVALTLVFTGTAPVRGVEYLRVILVAVTLASSALLAAADKKSAKPRALGRVMAFLAASLSLRLVRGGEYEGLWRAVHPEAFIGAAVLDFGMGFPAAGVSAALLRAGAGWGLFDFLARLAAAAAAQWGSPTGRYLFEELPFKDWIPTYLLALLAVFPLLRALSRSTGAEERQLRTFVRGFAVGVAPFALILPAAAFVPGFNHWLDLPEVQPVFLAVTYPFLFVFPITATYAVLFQGALDYQSALRRAAQYGLARYTLLGLIAVPFALGVVLLYANREEPLGRLLTGWRFLALAAVALSASAAFPLRHRLLSALDRRYFRESYDARIVLKQLTETVRKAKDIKELSRLLVDQVDTALHLESVVVMTTIPEEPGTLRPGAALGVDEPYPLPRTSNIVSLLAGSSAPLPLDPATPGSLVSRLPEQEREWLRAARATLLLPLLSSDETLLGFLALGPRKSETPFSAEDHDLLGSVSASAGLALETRLIKATPTPGGAGATPDRDQGPPARECLACLRIFEPTALSCPSCGAITQAAVLPLTLLGKYRLESRLGAGGFGVVYAATELRLGRRVALKTLPKLSGERVERFKREALAAAAIQHPNLAMIHTAETWNETPILVFELLERGTLAQRLLTRTLTIADALQVGKAMAGVLEEAHRRGILHRDIKPSNIGYDARNVPKLLDFGVARMREAPVEVARHGPDTMTLGHLQAEPVFDLPHTVDAGITETGVVVGTPAYLPLEAFQNHEPGPGFDLWALSVTLYESLTGLNPFRASTPAETIERLLRKTPLPVIELRPECPAAVSAFLVRALLRSPGERFGSAAEFREALEPLG